MTPASLPLGPSRVHFAAMSRVALTLLVLIASSAGCAGAAPTPHNQSHAEPHKAKQVGVERQVITATDESSLSELFEKAKRDFDAKRFEAAARGFQRVYELEPKGKLAPHALLNSAHALDEAGQLEAAYSGYRRTLAEFPQSEVARDALVRAVRLASFLERWSDAGQLADQGITRYPNLSPFEEVSLRSGKALELLQAGDVERAMYHIERARGVVESSQLDRAGRLPTELAQLYFALNEARRIRGEAIVFTPTPPNFGEVLERRAQLLLDAQSAYSDTMRAYDAHWSAMAGFRVGELYKRLHDDLMHVSPPPSADTERKRQLFEGAMRLRYSVLLKKGLQLIKHTLSMAARTAEESTWVSKARSAKQELEAAIQRENAAIDALPYTRAQLQAALDDLSQRATAKTTPPPP